MMRVYGKGERRKDDAASKCRRLTTACTGRAALGPHGPRLRAFAAAPLSAGDAER